MDKTPKAALQEIEALIDQKIKAHELRFSAFGILTAILAIILGVFLGRWIY